MQHYPITIQSHYESNHIPITESCDWGAWCTKCWRGGQCCPLPKLRPPAARGTLTPDIISQPVSPRPRKKDGSRFANPRKREKIRVARPSAGSIFLSPNSGGASWRWIHLSFPRTDKRAGAGSMALTPLGLHTQRQWNSV